MKKFASFTLAVMLMLLICTTAFADQYKLHTTTTYVYEVVDLTYPDGSHSLKSLAVAGAQTQCQVTYTNAGAPKSVSLSSYSGVKTVFTNGLPSFDRKPTVGGLIYQSAQLWSVTVSDIDLTYHYYPQATVVLNNAQQVTGYQPYGTSTTDSKSDLKMSFNVTPY